MGWGALRRSSTRAGMLSRAGYLTWVSSTRPLIRDGYGYDLGVDDFIWVRGQGDDTPLRSAPDARPSADRTRPARRPSMTAADSWLERHHENRFFLYVDTWDPHERWDPPDYYSKLYRPDFQGPALYPADAKWKDAGLT